MPTTKKSSEITLTKIVNSEKVNDIPIVVRKKRNHHNWFLLILILFTAIFCTRVPYVGSYIDTYVFELIFGWMKFFVYGLLLFIFVVLLIAPKIKSRIFTIKNVLCVGFVILIGILCLTIYTVVSNHSYNIRQYILSFKGWAKDIKYHTFIFHYCIPDGGILSLVLLLTKNIALCLVLAIITGILIFVVLLLTIYRNNRYGVNRFREWIIRKLGGSSPDKDESLAVKKHDIKIVPTPVEVIYHQAKNAEQLTPPISFLPNTHKDAYFDNKATAQDYQERLLSKMHQIKVIATAVGTKIMPLYSAYQFKLDNAKDFETIIQEREKFNILNTSQQINIAYKRNILNIELPNKTPSKISIKQIISMNSQATGLYSVIGIDENNVGKILEYKNYPSSIIIGKNGSGRNMLFSCMLLSLLYLNTPATLELILISQKNEHFTEVIAKTPHNKNKVLKDPAQIREALNAIINVIHLREEQFKNVECSNIYQFNSKQETPSTKLNFLMLAIMDYDQVSGCSEDMIQILNTILADGPKCGVLSLLSAESINYNSTNRNIFNEVKHKCILKVATELESKNIFESSKAWYLFGNGDGYIVDNENKSGIRFQSCYANIDELENIVTTINAFYDTKKHTV